MLDKVQKGNSTFLVCNIEPEWVIDKVTLAMVTSYKMQGSFVPMQLDSLNGTYTAFRFDITGMIPVSEFADHSMSQDIFRQVTLKMIDAIESLADYMLESTQVILELDKVYINPTDYQIGLICLPICDVTLPGSEYQLMRSFAEKSRVNVSRGEYSYFNSVWNVVMQQEGFSLKNVRKVLSLDGVNKEDAQQGGMATGNQTGPVTVNPAESTPAFRQNQQHEEESEKSSGKESLIGRLFKNKKAASSGGGIAALRENKGRAKASALEAAPVQEATPATPPMMTPPPVQNQPKKHTVYLVKVSTGERIEVNKPQFLLGRELGAADYCIRNNMSIGRRHATILVGQGGCEIVDHQSKNHTYLNGQAIESDKCIPIHNGAVIRLANEEFKFFEEF